MDWEQNVKRLIEDYFLSFDISYTPKNSTSSDYLIDFLNLKMKLIQPLPRVVFKSNRFRKLQIPYETLLSLISIDEKIRKGDDITFHMSKQVLNPSYNDLLLNTWIVHHIHLSRTKKNSNQKFYDRADYLLFVIFSENAAYFLDVLKHKEENLFSKQDYLKIIDENWPEILDEYDLNKNGGNTRAVDYTDEEIREITKKGYSLGMINVGNRTIFYPGYGIMTTGHNFQVVRQADYIKRYLYETYTQILENEDSIMLQLKEMSDISKLDLSLQLTDNFPYFEFFERNTGATLRP